MTQKYSLKCVLDGRDFEMPQWSVKKHEALLESMIEYDEKLGKGEIAQKDFDRKYRLNMILLSLKEVDPNVKESDILEMHPDDFIDLWMSVYNSGKKGIRKKEDFQTGEKTPK